MKTGSNETKVIMPHDGTLEAFNGILPRWLFPDFFVKYKKIIMLCDVKLKDSIGFLFIWLLTYQVASLLTKMGKNSWLA